jgi:hypothetical protein
MRENSLTQSQPLRVNIDMKLNPIVVVCYFVKIRPRRSSHLERSELGLNETGDGHAIKLTMPD